MHDCCRDGWMLRRLKSLPMKTLWAHMMMKMRPMTTKLTSLKLLTTSDLRFVVFVQVSPTNLQCGCQHLERLSVFSRTCCSCCTKCFTHSQHSKLLMVAFNQSLAYHGYNFCLGGTLMLSMLHTNTCSYITIHTGSVPCQCISFVSALTLPSELPPLVLFWCC